MEEAIKNLPTQFNFQPVVQNAEGLVKTDSFVVCGMGGSHLAAGLLKILYPQLDLYVHRDYGLPALAEKKLSQSLYIASSYSGNTEEVLDFAEKAFTAKHSLVIIAVGGKLIDFAKKHSLPYIQLPNNGIQPRSALGYSLLSLAKMVAGDDVVRQLQAVGATLRPQDFAQEGERLAESLRGKVPIIYSSRKNLAVAYNWKIKCNETGKIPAFYNTFSELNHNEMTGFDVVESTANLSANFHFIFLEDSDDDPKIKHRMKVLAKMYQDRNLSVAHVSLKGSTAFEKIFNSLLLADWTALSLAKIYDTEAEQVPMVEEFKKLIA